MPVLRSNRKNPDPILFAVYGDVIYHHGAGFRPGVLTTGHYAGVPRPLAISRLPVVRRLMRHLEWRRRQAWARSISAEQIRQSERIFAGIERGGRDWLAELV